MALVAYSDESDITDSDEETVMVSNGPKADVHKPSTSVVTCSSADNGILQPGFTIVHQDPVQLNHSPSGNVYDDILVQQEDRSLGSVVLNIPEAKPIAKLHGPSLDVSEETDEVTDVPTVETWNVMRKLRTSLSSSVIQQTQVSNVTTSRKKQKVKIVLPALSEYVDNHEEVGEKDDEPIKKVLKPSCKGTSLFSLLPAPKQFSSKKSSRSLVPHVLTKTGNKKTIRPKVAGITRVHSQSNTLPGGAENLSDEDDSLEDEQGSDFFSLSQKHDIGLLLPLKVDNSVEDEQDASSSYDIGSEVMNTSMHMEVKPYASPQDIDDDYKLNNSQFEPERNLHNSIDQTALSRLAGKHNRRKGEVMNFIHISADDALMNREEWMTKSLTEEKPSHSFSKKQEGMPSQVQKRKHQITYLAFQAKERELELKNAWATSRLSKRQTQAKYGF